MSIKLAAIQMVSGPDLEKNLEAAARLVAGAADAGADLVLLPEVFAVLEGGPMRPFAEEEGAADGVLQQFLSGLAKQHDITVVGGTIPLISRPGRSRGDADYLVPGELVRASCLVYNSAGEQIARYDKIHLFDVRVDDKQAEYSESRSYEAGSDVVCVDSMQGRLGLSVCYDMRFPELYRELFRQGAQIITIPAAFTRVTGKAHWETLLRARAIENQSYVVAAAQGGKHNEKRETWGHSMIVDPWGSILSHYDQGEGLAIAEIDLQHLADIRSRMPVANHRKL